MNTFLGFSAITVMIIWFFACMGLGLRLGLGL